MILPSLLVASLVLASASHAQSADKCSGYKAQNIQTSGSSMSATLVLAGTACNIYGADIPKLSLQVDYETADRIHLKIVDASAARYEVPTSVFPRPPNNKVSSGDANIQFQYTASPFSFKIVRTQSKEVLFDTTSHPIVFEPQYLRLATNLPSSPHIYGLGEHTDPLQLPTHNYTRTMWSKDAYGVPSASNLYGNHPIYFEHRTTGTHGVFFLNSNGLDIKINDASGTTLEYNAIGGVLDYYFLAGSTLDPTEVARQYAEIVGTPAEVPYWSFGFHQCRYGYTDWVNVADVITNYSIAGIPLETMWTDIDYMYQRWVFTNDPSYFPTDKMREIVNYLHAHDQHYVLMTDPAVAHQPGGNYSTFTLGTQEDLWLKNQPGIGKDFQNASIYQLGVVWPGVTVFPDWFHPKMQSFWSGQYESFFNKDTGIDIDGAWIDMNEPSNFACNYPCVDPWDDIAGFPPDRTTPIPDSNTPIFQNATASDLASRGYAPLGEQFDKRGLAKKAAMARRAEYQELDLERRQHYGSNSSDGVDVLFPPYTIANSAGPLSAATVNVSSLHNNGLILYDTHNIFGSMMSIATHNAMLARRPGLRTLVITRSTFAGAGAKVGKWLGDNFSDWGHYLISIQGQLSMAAIYQIPMVGSDVCGYANNSTETLCARWAMLGAFSPFYRNHNAVGTVGQEFYQWPLVAQAAKNAIDIRYRLLDYIYTAMHRQSVDGTPLLNPLWFQYPQDQNTYPIDLQFLYGDSILVSPVTVEGATDATFYLPNDQFYDFLTGAPVRGQGANITLNNVDYTSIPLHIRGGAVIPLRAKSGLTTTEVRSNDFEIVVAPGLTGNAAGTLYVDDGVSVNQPRQTNVQFTYSGSTLAVTGQFGYALGVKVADVKFLGVAKNPGAAKVNGKAVASSAVAYNSTTQVYTVTVNLPFTGGFTVSL